MKVQVHMLNVGQQLHRKSPLFPNYRDVKESVLQKSNMLAVYGIDHQSFTKFQSLLE